MDNYELTFYGLSAICFVLFTVFNPNRKPAPSEAAKLLSNDDDSNDDKIMKNLHLRYLTVYSFAALGDWLQGPYLYALYESYGLVRYDIHLLFYCGFTSSMVFGPFCGYFSDKYGRKLNCIAYCIIYAASCITKQYNDFTILMLGRVLGGIATSILWSAFESWIISQHKIEGKSVHPDKIGGYINTVFGNQVFINGLVAIIAGILAQKVSDLYGYVAPFNVGAMVLCFCMGIILLLWTENYGEESQNTKGDNQFSKVWKVLKTEKEMNMVGLTQALFESSMYCFVSEWTPALNTVEGVSLPFGTIFSAFMVSMMIGTYFFKVWIATQKGNGNLERLMVRCLMMSFVVFAMTPFISTPFQRFAMFLMFEMCVGVFWPTISSLRSSYIPEDVRSMVMNIFRIPLNFLVVAILAPEFSVDRIFSICSCLLLVTVYVMNNLAQKKKNSDVIADRC